jgi:heme/copper-type cytochrome/quinol oxidase subunit 2
MEIAPALLPVILISVPLVWWTLMLLHAAQEDIPNKPLWILVLILGGIVGAVVYYFAVYRDASKQNKGFGGRTILTAVLILLVIPATIFVAMPPKNRLKEIPLSDVIQQANRDEIKSIRVKGDELEITRYGETVPTERSRKESGSSLYEQGLTSKKVQIHVKD